MRGIPTSAAGKAGAAIELRGLVKRYGGEVVVDHVDITIGAGEFFSLLGPSGSGKSTTLMMLAGFAAVDGDRVLVDGVDLAGVAPQRRGFGMVFQHYAIFPHLDVYENIAFPLRARGMHRAQVAERVERVLELVQLQPFARKHARQLSGGQQQRVAIARAVVFEPGVVLMDEPLGALDRKLRYEMQAEIKDIQRRLGMTVVYVTHDQEEAMAMSDRLAILNHGRIEQVGAPAEVYEAPATAFVGRFLGEANLVPGVVVAAGNGVALQGADGLVLPLAEATLPPGAQAAFFVRPGRIRPLAPGATLAPGWTGLPGSVEQCTFLGGIVRLRVRVGAATLFTVDLPNDGQCAPLVAGAPVQLSWQVAHGRLLQDAAP